MLLCSRPPAALEANRNFLRFERKVHSLAYSSFRSALLLDSDNIPLVNPEVSQLAVNVEGENTGRSAAASWESAAAVFG
jgi:hypothetical protein